jgi:hypothetical protein
MIRTKADWQAMRELIGLSTADLAKYLNKNVATLQYWENPSPSARRYHPSVRAWQFLEMIRLKQIEQIKDHLETHFTSLDYDEMREIQHHAPLRFNEMTRHYRVLGKRDPLLMTIDDILGDMDEGKIHSEHAAISPLQTAAVASSMSIHGASGTQSRRVIIHYQHTSSSTDTEDKIGFNQQALAIALMLAAQGQHVRFEYAK